MERYPYKAHPQCDRPWNSGGRYLLYSVFPCNQSCGQRDRDILSARLIAGKNGIEKIPAISLADRGIGIFCVSVPLLVLTWIVPGCFGGGDIKLMAASGIFLGREANLEAFALAVFLAGGYCIWMLLRKKLSRRERIAFGPFLCAGIIAKMLIAL